MFGDNVMKKIFLGLGSALFIVGSVIGMDDRDETSHVTRSRSAPDIRTKLTERSTQISRSNSAPLTAPKVLAAISKWSHLVHAGETKKHVERLVPQVLANERAMPELVSLICNSEIGKEYAHYAKMLYFDIDFGERNADDDHHKYGKMLSAITGDRNRGYTNQDIYWNEYTKGYYNICLPSMEDDEYMEEEEDL
jgi:hypothetical protein